VTKNLPQGRKKKFGSKESRNGGGSEAGCGSTRGRHSLEEERRTPGIKRFRLLGVNFAVLPLLYGMRDACCVLCDPYWR
jgi:hypothetical protein